MSESNTSRWLKYIKVRARSEYVIEMVVVVA